VQTCTGKVKHILPHKITGLTRCILHQTAVTPAILDRRLRMSYTCLLGSCSESFEPGTVELLMIKACGVGELESI
jgi:hypothetical protein